MDKDNAQRELAQQLDWIQERVALVKRTIGAVIVGQNEVIEGALIGLFCGGHVLLEGVPGVGKTLLVRTLASALELDFSRVQFTPDLMPSDIVGTQVLSVADDGERVFSFRPGPIFTHVLLADEVNRSTPKTQSALLEAMAEQRVTVGRQTHQLAPPFFVMATQNPLEMEGTYPLPEAQLDRFMFKLNVPFPSRDDLHSIVERTITPAPAEVKAVMSGSDILTIRRVAIGCPCARHVTDLAIRLVEATHGGAEAAKRYLRAGASPRAVQALVVGAKMRAVFDGRDNVSTDDVRALTPAVLGHRVMLNFDAEADGVDPRAVIDALLQEIKN